MSDIPRHPGELETLIREKNQWVVDTFDGIFDSDLPFDEKMRSIDRLVATVDTGRSQLEIVNED